MSKIVLYQEAITGVTTNGEQYALFINEDGLPTVKNGSQVVVFGTSGYAMQGSSGSSGLNGTNGLSGTSGEDGSNGSSGQDGEMGSSGTSGQDGSSGSSGADGVSGDNGSSGSSGISYGTSGVSGSAGSSGTSLAPITEDLAVGYSDMTTNQTVQYDALIYFLDFSYANPSFLTQIFALSGDTFNSLTNSFYTGQYLAYSHLKGKKLTSVTLDRLNSSTPPLTGKTESLTTSAYFKIWKGSAASSGTITLTEVYSYDLDGIIDFNYGGSTERIQIDLSGENIQAGFNEFLVSSIEREYEPLTSTSKFVNRPGITVYFETVASGILGTNGTSGQHGSAGSSGFSGANGTAGSSGLSYGSSGTSGGTGSAGANGTNGLTGSSGSSGQTGTSGVAGMNGTSGTSAPGGGGGAVDFFGPDFGTTVLDDTVTNQYGYKYLYGWYGNANHWGYDNARNFEYGFTIPVTVPAGKQLKTVYFPIECDTADTDIDFKFVMWDKKEGTYYPYNYLGEINHTFNFASTGYKLIAFDINFPNDGTWTGATDNTYFLSIVTNDVDTAMRFRAYVDWYNYDLRGGIFNPSDGQFVTNQIYGLNRVYNSSWFTGSGVPAIYGPGPGNGYTMGATYNPVFYSISEI